MTYFSYRRLGLAALWLACTSPIACDGDEPEGSTDATDTEGADTDPTGPTGDPTEDPSTGNPSEDPSTGDTSEDPSTGDTDPGEDTDGPADPGVDLFACEVELSCEQVIWHIDPEPLSATECVATQMAAQAPGAFSILETLGPYVDESESISIIRGDGTVIRQFRQRACESCDTDTLPWELEAPQLCQVRIDVENYGGCLEGTYECLAAYAFLDCEPYEGASCEGVLADLQGEAPALVECGDDSCPFGTVCVQEPDACECDSRTGEMGYVPVAPTCHNAPEDCGNAQDGWDAECVGALCESGGHEFDVLEDGRLACGEDAGDCFGEC